MVCRPQTASVPESLAGSKAFQDYVVEERKSLAKVQHLHLPCMGALRENWPGGTQEARGSRALMHTGSFMLLSNSRFSWTVLHS